MVVLAVVCLSIGLLLQSATRYVSSADAAADAVESVLSDAEFRNSVAEEIVKEVEAENSDSPQRLLFIVARQSLVRFVAQKLKDPVAANVAADVVRGAYRVYVDGEQVVTVDVSRFSDIANDALTAIDARLSTSYSDSFKNLTIQRPRDSQQLGGFITVAQIAAWVLLVVGAILVTLLWRKEVQSRKAQLQMTAIVFGATSVVLGILVSLIRKISPQFSTEYSDVVSVLADFVTGPGWTRAIVCAVLASVLGVVSVLASWRQNRS